MILLVWLLLPILNVASFSQACKHPTPNLSICENDVLRIVEQNWQLAETGMENLRLKIDNLDMEINQKFEELKATMTCAGTKSTPNIQENPGNFKYSTNPPINCEDICKPKNSESEHPSPTKSPSITISPSPTTSPSTTISPSITEIPSTTKSPSTTKAPTIPSNCTEAIRLSGRPKGIHTILIPGSHLGPFEVYCLGSIKGTAYTIIQRRVNDSTDFERPWVDYVRGFGNLEGSFWIGLEKLHELTKSPTGGLLIEMEDFDNNKAWAKYTDFFIGNATESFALRTLGSYEGDAGDALSYHVGQGFTTKDVDNDWNEEINCAVFHKGAWWYKNCFHSNLNGKYLRDNSQQGIAWDTFHSLKYVQMAIGDIPYISSNCTEALELSGRWDGIFKIRIPNSHLEPFDVYCESSWTGSVYTVIQRRSSERIPFKRPWVDYVQGFGNLNADFWIGLEKLHELTKSPVSELWIEMVDFDNNRAWARYTDFVIGNATESFALKTLGSYEGDAGDALRYHVGQKFSTKDVDNYLDKELNCAALHRGAWWWYKNCFHSNFNGKYLRGNSEQGIAWDEFHSLKYIKMAIRKIPYIPNSCTEAVRLSDRGSGIYKIRIPNSQLEPFDVYCESSREGRFYTVIQRRVNDSTDFERPWVDYVRGFGSLSGSYWLGLEKIHELTKSSTGDLLIKMENFANNKAWARYTDFVIGNATESFALKTLGSYEGDAGDALRYHVGQKFSAKDVDNDWNKEINCAVFHKGAWWYKNCFHSNLNGKYLQNNSQQGIAWDTFHSLKYVQMAIRFIPYIPSNCTEAVRLSGRRYGIHRIRIPNSRLEPFDVYCKSSRNGRVSTVIQRRVNDSIDFERPWVDYVRGFGSLSGSYWMGLEKIHELTKSSTGDLLIEMQHFDNDKAWAKYTDFVIGNATESFALKTLGSYKGNAGDSLRYHVGRKFSTRDVDNDWNEKINCAVLHKGAWWYGSCYESNLNGKYLRGISDQGIVWQKWKWFYSLKYVQMTITS